MKFRGRRVDAAGGIRPRLTVNGTTYNGTSLTFSGTTYEDKADEWTTNPDTTAAWTVDDVNGTGANPLEEVALLSTGLSAGQSVRATQMYLEVEYTAPCVPFAMMGFWGCR